MCCALLGFLVILSYNFIAINIVINIVINISSDLRVELLAYEAAQKL